MFEALLLAIYVSHILYSADIQIDKCLTYIYVGQADAVGVTVILKRNISADQVTVSNFICTVLLPTQLLHCGGGVAGEAGEQRNRVYFCRRAEDIGLTLCLNSIVFMSESLCLTIKHDILHVGAAITHQFVSYICADNLLFSQKNQPYCGSIRRGFDRGH